MSTGTARPSCKAAFASTREPPRAVGCDASSVVGEARQRTDGFRLSVLPGETALGRTGFTRRCASVGWRFTVQPPLESAFGLFRPDLTPAALAAIHDGRIARRRMLTVDAHGLRQYSKPLGHFTLRLVARDPA